MSRIPSIGLVELIILAGIAGLVTLIVAIVVVVIVKSRKRSDTHRPAEAGLHELEVTAKEPRNVWKWVAILVLLVLFVLPLFAVVCGILWVVPIRSTQSIIEEPSIQVVAVDAPTATPLPALTASDATPTDTPQPTPTATDTPQSTSVPGSPSLSLNPHSPAILIILPGIAGLVLLIGAAAIALIVKRWKGSDTQLKDTSTDGDNGIWAKTTKLRYAFLAFAFWLALSAFLILDILGSVSLYFRFAAIYTAFWVLAGALLLYGRPIRDKLLILGLFVIVLFSVRFIDWNSRKPFLKDFYSIKEGMTAAQVEQIMGDYMKGGGRPLNSPQTEINERGEIVTGTSTYRHTNEGWGDSDWGVVTFEDGRVVQTEFLPD